VREERLQGFPDGREPRESLSDLEFIEIDGESEWKGLRTGLLSGQLPLK